MNWEKCEWIGEKDNQLRKVWMNLICIEEYVNELDNNQYYERGLQNNEINLGLSGWIKNHKGLIMK